MTAAVTDRFADYRESMTDLVLPMTGAVMTWTCELCPSHPLLADWTALQRHFGRRHPDVVREVRWPTPSDVSSSSTPAR